MPEKSKEKVSPTGSRTKYRPTREGEGRILLLIDTFSRKKNAVRYLEGRVKLAKLDFLLRYPHHLRRLLLAHGVNESQLRDLDAGDSPLDSRMMRYRYGPWDPSYYAILGSLIGRGLVEVVPLGGRSGFGYRTSQLGAELASALRDDESFFQLEKRLQLLRKYLDKSGATLKGYLYELPEVADAAWNEDVK